MKLSVESRASAIVMSEQVKSVAGVSAAPDSAVTVSALDVVAHPQTFRTYGILYSQMIADCLAFLRRACVQSQKLVYAPGYAAVVDYYICVETSAQSVRFASVLIGGTNTHISHNYVFYLVVEDHVPAAYCNTVSGSGLTEDSEVVRFNGKRSGKFDRSAYVEHYYPARLRYSVGKRTFSGRVQIGNVIHFDLSAVVENPASARRVFSAAYRIRKSERFSADRI